MEAPLQGYGMTPDAKEREAKIIREAIEEGVYCPNCKCPWSDCDCDERMEWTDEE